MHEDPRVEAVARALCEERGEDPDEELRCFLIAGIAFEESDPLPLWHEWLPEARAALAAADAAAWRPISEAPRDDELRWFWAKEWPHPWLGQWNPDRQGFCDVMYGMQFWPSAGVGKPATHFTALTTPQKEGS